MASRQFYLRDTLLGIMLLLSILLIWEWAVRSGRISLLALPRPSLVLVEGARQLSDRTFALNWSRTMVVWFSSLTMGLAVGLILGFAAGSSARLSIILLPSFGFLRSIPPIALFPVALVALGPGSLSVGSVATIAAALYVFPGTAEAARETANRFIQLASILGCSRWLFLRLFVAPGAAVHALASTRVAATVAFAVCVAGEMIIGGRTGVGAAILDLSERYKLEAAYAYILYTGLVGLLIDLTFDRLTRIRMIANRSQRAMGIS